MGPGRVESRDTAEHVVSSRPRRLEVLTPTYGPDLELCRDLNASVRRFGDDVLHRIIASPADLRLIRELARDGTELVSREEFIPPFLVASPLNAHLDRRRPWWPVRGWIMQQVVKLEATARSSADVVVVADSDLAFIRPFGLDSFTAATGPEMFRLDDAVHNGMLRHVQWHRVARRLLGLDPTCAPPLADYICWPCPWEPQMVRDMLKRVETVHGKPWQRLVAGQRHFSEMILYGVYVDEVASADRDHASTARMRCIPHHEETSLDEMALHSLLARAAEDDLAVMISAKSGTDLAVRRRALARATG